MKKLFLKSMMVLGIASALVACEKDETTPNSNTNTGSQLVGTWDVNLEIDRSYIGTTLISSDTIVFGTTMTSVYTFNSDGSAMNVYNDNGTIDTSTFRYSTSGNVLTLLSPPDTSTATFTINGNSLVVNAEGTFGTVRYTTERRLTKR